MDKLIATMNRARNPRNILTDFDEWFRWEASRALLVAEGGKHIRWWCCVDGELAKRLSIDLVD